MLPIQMPAVHRTRNPKAIGLLLVSLVFSFAPLAWPQQPETPSMQDMQEMNQPHADMNASSAPEDPVAAAARLAWKRESEFNHHLAGFLVALAGIILLCEDRLVKRWPLVRYAWPACFLAAGLFLLVFSDTEIWPFGPQTPWYAITHNMEDLQHKLFSVMLLAIGYVEFERARGRFTAAWIAWIFPVVGMAGAILLVFHVHGGNMRAPHAMETMEHIQKQHHWFALSGFGIALTNGLAETPTRWQEVFKKVWPALLIILGILLMHYTE